MKTQQAEQTNIFNWAERLASSSLLFLYMFLKISANVSWLIVFKDCPSC